MKRACTKEQLDIRKNEIINTVSKMFDEMDYQDISMKTISEKISIARSSLYCYYNSKEEIMLDVLKNDYIKFLNSLTSIFDKKDSSIDIVIDQLARAYMSNLKIMKIISLYLTDIEMHCSLESLINFKKDFVNPMSKLKEAIKSYFDLTTSENTLIIFNSLLMFTNSLYPMINPIDKQKEAMKIVGMELIDDGFDFCKKYFSFLLKK